MLIVCILRRSLYIYPRLLTTVHFVLSSSPRPQAAELNFFYQVETFLLLFSLCLSLFLIFGQSEPVLKARIGKPTTSSSIWKLIQNLNFLKNSRVQIYFTIELEDS